MISALPFIKFLSRQYGEELLSPRVVEEVAKFTNLPVDFVFEHLVWLHGTSRLEVLQYIAECYNYPLDEMFFWEPSKGAKKIYTKWETKMARRWDRYRKYWIDTMKTCKKQNYDLDFKLNVLKEYRESNLSLREIAEKHDIQLQTVRTWMFKWTQV